MLNKVIIIGNLGQDPEFKQTARTGITNLSIATSERYKDKASGETKTITEWHKVVFFNKQAEIARDFLVKGSKVYVEGKIRTEKYTDKDGIERYITKILGGELKMLDANPHKEKPEKAPKQTEAFKEQEDAFEDDQDIPF
jgi:single-strand DNA-binding protein